MTNRKEDVILINKELAELTEKEEHLIRKLREIPYGQVLIFMQDGQPVRIEKGIKSEKL